MTKFIAMKAVYCYHLPEVRALLHEVEQKLPDDMNLVTTPASKVAKDLEALFDPALDIPETEEGFVDLDMIHRPIIERIISAYSEVVPALDDFPYAYPSSGSSEGLFHLLADYAVSGCPAVNLLEGEYEGYLHWAKHLGMNVNVFSEHDARNAGDGVWFISNPSARDGNIIPNEFINDLCHEGHEVVLDLAYVGATKPYEFDVSNGNIPHVVMSFSKPYGVFRQRIGGFVYSRQEVPHLAGQNWFKDILRLCQALKLAEEIGPGGLYEKYSKIQAQVIWDLNGEFGLGLRASDSFLLAHLKEEDVGKLGGPQLEIIKPYKRNPGYRFCLTPYFEMKE